MGPMVVVARAQIRWPHMCSFKSVLPVNDEQLISCSSCSDNKCARPPKHSSAIRGEQPVCSWLAETQPAQPHVRWTLNTRFISSPSPSSSSASSSGIIKGLTQLWNVCMWNYYVPLFCFFVFLTVYLPLQVRIVWYHLYCYYYYAAIVLSFKTLSKWGPFSFIFQVINPPWKNIGLKKLCEGIMKSDKYWWKKNPRRFKLFDIWSFFYYFFKYVYIFSTQFCI